MMLRLFDTGAQRKLNPSHALKVLFVPFDKIDSFRDVPSESCKDDIRKKVNLYITYHHTHSPVILV